VTKSTNVTTTNWSGAVIQATPGKSLNAVSADWTVPTVSQVPIKGVTTTDLSSWVGLDGYNSKDVAQAGIQETVSTGANGNTTVSYSAWDEWYPASSNNIPSSAFKVDPGDTVKITIETTGAGATTATFLYDDETTGQNYQTSLTAPHGISLTGSSAEFVVETPEWSNGFSTYQPPLSDFLGSPVVFQDASATYAGGGAASLSSALTIGMVTNGVPGVFGYTREAYGSVSASADTVTVAEDDYWAPANSLDPFGHGHWMV
jgi:Peptidase A4 family